MRVDTAVRIGFQVDSIDSSYTRTLIEGVDAFCRGNGIDLVVFSGRSFGWPFGFEFQNNVIFDHIREPNVDALVIASGTQCNFIGPERFASYVATKAPLPVVSIAVRVNGVENVLGENEIGLRELTEHLIDRHKCRSFLVVTGPEGNFDSNERLAVVRTVLGERGLSFGDDSLVRGQFSSDTTAEEMARYFDSGGALPDAIVALSDVMAMGVLQVLEKRGLRVPDDVIVTGFDDVSRSRFSLPPLTTVSQNLFRQGWLAARRARDAVVRGGAEADSRSDTVVSTRAVLRQSCGCLPEHETSVYGKAIDGTALEGPVGLEISSGVRRFELSDDMFRLRRYLSRVNAAEKIDDCFLRLRADLESFDIASCAIVLYGKRLIRPVDREFRLPDAACLELRYDEAVPAGAERLGYVFNPRERMIPEGTFSSRSRTLVASALYHREEQLGYILYEPGSVDSSVYETICVQISSMVNAAVLLAEKEEVGNLLSEALRNLEETNRKLDVDSRTDELTGLMNRRGFLSSGQAMISQAIRRGKEGIVIFGDLDGLKAINDEWGHDAGDRALVAMSAALKRVFRSEDVVARLSGDEFAAVANDLLPSDLPGIRARLDAALARRNSASGEPFKVSISLGCMEFSPENRDLETLLSLADGVLYEEKRAKHAGRRA